MNQKYAMPAQSDQSSHTTYMRALGHIYSSLSDLPAWFRRLTPGQLQDIAKLMAQWYEPSQKSNSEQRPITFGDILNLEQVERNVILVAIRTYNGDMVRAAGALGIGKTTIYRKLREWGYTARSLSQASALESSDEHSDKSGETANSDQASGVAAR